MLNKFDELNVIWVSKMGISDREKVLRVSMMSSFGEDITAIFDKQKEVTEKNKNKEKILLGVALLSNEMINAYRRMTNRFFKKYLSEVSDKNKPISDFSKAWLKKQAHNYSDNVLKTTLRYISNGEPEKAFTDSRLSTISRTEINAICECATLEGYLQDGYEGKRWISYLDGKERKTHRWATGQVKSLFDPFEVGDSLLMFPQDSSLGAGAGEIVHCRCYMTPVRKIL